MKNMMHVASGIDVAPLVLAIKRQPWLWNQYSVRREQYNSPHGKLSDIWVRYNAWENYNEEEGRERFNDEHDSVWYPAYDALPEVSPIVFGLMASLQGERLGGVLITKIPPGGICEPHIDTGWHAEYYDKYAVQLESHPLQAFHFEGESFSARPGDVYWFDNSQTHWVTNESDFDRMTMIVCIRSRRGGK